MELGAYPRANIALLNAVSELQVLLNDQKAKRLDLYGGRAEMACGARATLINQGVTPGERRSSG